MLVVRLGDFEASRLMPAESVHDVLHAVVHDSRLQGSIGEGFKAEKIRISRVGGVFFSLSF